MTYLEVTFRVRSRLGRTGNGETADGRNRREGNGSDGEDVEHVEGR